MDEVLKRGMKKIPKMGRRSNVLESDGETYGRVGLLGEYLRRQTGKIRNRTQCVSDPALSLVKSLMEWLDATQVC